MPTHEIESRDLSDYAAGATTPLRTVFRTLFESGFHNDFEAMAATIADDCEWTLIPDWKTYRGKAACVELCKQGKLASDKTPEIVFDVATPRWGAFEYVNAGVITPEAVEFAKTTGWQFPSDPSLLIGKKYRVGVCFIYQINPNGEIYHLNEYLDMAGLMKQFQ
jgi:ketosteroid isomerase-like protein